VFYPANIKDTSDSLLDSRLRGHAKHAFTGADIERRGLFELAHLGTLFLDEIAEASLDAQAKLLRPINDRCVQRLGEEEHFRPFNVRLISATHQDLEAAVRAGTFREDFYYRLSVIRIDVPALRHRKEDIPLLTDEFLRSAARRFRGPEAAIPVMDAAARRVLDRHDWPGNVRELENAIERSVALGNGRIGPSDLGDLAGRAEATVAGIKDGTLAEQMNAAEREILCKRLSKFPDDLPGVARSLGIGVSTLRKRRSKHRIQAVPHARH
jgi:DNA-binding NtrC family response regulator